MLVEKKLRDVTKEEFEEWNNRSCFGRKCDTCIFRNVNCSAYEDDAWVNNKDIYSDKFLDRTIQVKVDEILDEKEKEYLSYVIKPFKHRIEYIRKFKSGHGQCISIKIIDGDFMYFPDFVNTNMYVGLMLDKKYTLKELGL